MICCFQCTCFNNISYEKLHREPQGGPSCCPKDIVKPIKQGKLLRPLEESPKVDSGNVTAVLAQILVQEDICSISLRMSRVTILHGKKAVVIDFKRNSWSCRRYIQTCDPTCPYIKTIQGLEFLSICLPLAVFWATSY